MLGAHHASDSSSAASSLPSNSGILATFWKEEKQGQREQVWASSPLSARTRSEPSGHWKIRARHEGEDKRSSSMRHSAAKDVEERRSATHELAQPLANVQCSVEWNLSAKHVC